MHTISRTLTTKFMSRDKVERLKRVLDYDPELESWQVAERFGITTKHARDVMASLGHAEHPYHWWVGPNFSRPGGKRRQYMHKLNYMEIHS